MSFLAASQLSSRPLGLVRLRVQQHQPFVEHFEVVAHLLQIAVELAKYGLDVLVGQLDDVRLGLWFGFAVGVDEQVAVGLCDLDFVAVR